MEEAEADMELDMVGAMLELLSSCLFTTGEAVAKEARAREASENSIIVVFGESKLEVAEEKGWWLVVVDERKARGGQSLSLKWVDRKDMKSNAEKVRHHLVIAPSLIQLFRPTVAQAPGGSGENK